VFKGVVMLIFGHRFINSENFYHINSIEAVDHTPSNSTLFINFCEKNLDIITHLRENGINFALEVKSVTEAIYAENLDAKYIVADHIIAKNLQKIADNYLFDSKIIVHCDSEDRIEEFAFLGIDGVIFSEAIVKIS
jgi:nicotinate-nucleotide pyrophosphorylase